ncbi:MAG: hypothetical protein ACXVIB_07305 [Halobacteriota archaeon]
MKSPRKVRERDMRSIIIYPWLVEEFIQWLKPDVSKWAIDYFKAASSEGSDEELIEQNVILALSHYDTLRWFEDGRLVGSKNNELHEIADNLKDYRFNGLFYSGLFGTEGEAEW